VKELEDEPQVTTAERRQARVGEVLDRHPADAHRALGRPVDAADELEQRRLP
jgi:hypothetical protein